MTSSRLIIAVLLSTLLTACYGTKVGSPDRSFTGPIDQTAITSAPRPAALPDDLSALLLTYRQSLIADAHHLSEAVAQRYADAEIASLKQRFHGREKDLRHSIQQRLASDVQNAQPASPRNQAGTGYPADAAEGSIR